MYFLLIGLKFKKSTYFEELENIYLNMNKNTKEDFLNKVNNFFAKNKQINSDNKNFDLFIFLSEKPEALKFLLRLTEDEMESLYQFIIDSDYNEQIYLFSLKNMKIYFQNLNNKYDYEIVEKINNNLIENLDNYMKAFPYLVEFNKKKIGKLESFNEILNELENSIFYIQYNILNQKYELTNITSNEEQILEDYNELIIEKSFFAISHSMDDKSIYDKLKNILEINNYIKEYISLKNKKKYFFKEIFSSKGIYILEILNLK